MEGTGLGLYASREVRSTRDWLAFWRPHWWSGLHDVRVASFDLSQAVSAQRVQETSPDAAFTAELLQEGAAAGAGKQACVAVQDTNILAASRMWLARSQASPGREELARLAKQSRGSAGGCAAALVSVL